MFGKTIKRHCQECQKEVLIKVSTSYRVNGKAIYTEGYCHRCPHDLFEADRATLQDALNEGQSIGNEIGIAML